MSETIYITFLLLSFYFLYKWKEEGFILNKTLLLTILFFMFSIYTKATITILPLILIPIFVFIYKGLKYSLKIFIIVIILYLFFMSVWWIRNYVLLNKVVFFTTSSGANLYLGNNNFNKSGGCDWSKDVDKNFVLSLRKANYGEIKTDNIFKRKAFEFIKNNPFKFLELMKDKFFRFWNIQFNNKKFRNSIYNYIMIFSFTPILFGFLISLFFLKKEMLIVLILIIYYTFIHSFIIASLRYRLPIEPFLIIFAVYGYSKFYKKLAK